MIRIVKYTVICGVEYFRFIYRSDDITCDIVNFPLVSDFLFKSKIVNAYMGLKT